MRLTAATMVEETRSRMKERISLQKKKKHKNISLQNCVCEPNHYRHSTYKG